MGGCCSGGVSMSIPVSAIVSHSSCHPKYIYNLEENLQNLYQATHELKARRDDLLRRIAREEYAGRIRLTEVQVWITRVEFVAQEVYEFLEFRVDEELSKLCLCGYCSTSFISSCSYGKRTQYWLKEVESLLSPDFRFSVVVERPIYTPVVSSTVLLGQDRRLEEIRRLLMEDDVGVLALYGMGGVGKTTLLSQLNSIQEVSHFDILIWITASKSVQNHRILEYIGKELGIYNEEWGLRSESEKVMIIYDFLRKKRFLVLCDDLCEKLNLEQIGIPLPTRENGCKIVITSRSRVLCEIMRADVFFEVQPLEEEEAWKLFRRNVGETTLQSHPEIPKLARRTANICRGLPLALQVVGASMASQTSIQAWQHALDRLAIHDQVDAIMVMLKFCYDALEGKQVKLCFLLFALFPYDQEIRKELLVELWIGEGIIDDKDKDQGYEIIRILVATNLLMEAGESRDRVRMHDILRELALRIASRAEDDNEDFIDESFTQVGRLLDIKNWRDVSRVSLVRDDIKTIISGNFDCPKLKTFFLRDTNLETISPEFFSGMPLLLVLDLSSNEHLNILPDTISELVSLRHLNLSSTGIKKLPLGLSKLKKLAYLYLEHTHLLKDITGISQIVNIQVLRLCDSGFRTSRDLLEELQLLEHLELLTITLQDEDVVKELLSCPKLAKCTQGFYLDYCAILSSISFTSISSSLRCLDVQDSYIPEVMIDRSATGGEAIISLDALPSDALFTNLNEVRLDGCNGLRKLTWLLYAPNLKKLRVMQSRDIEEIISKKKAANLDIVPFQKLEFLALEGLERLRSIYWRPLPLPELREIRVRSCPGLTRLPLDSESAKGQNLVLSAEKEWMKEIIEWEDEATKQRLFPS